MRFDFTEEQYALRDGAREFLAGECTTTHLRQTWESADGVDAGRWKQLAETGMLGAMVPEEFDGLGLDEVDVVLLLEEAGYAALPEPLTETAAVAVPALIEAGTAEQQHQWLPRIASGDAVATIALGGDTLVPAGHVADLVVLEHDGLLHAVPSERFTATQELTVDHGRRVATVMADVSDATAMPGGPETVMAAADRAAAATAAFLNGVSRRLLDMTVDYVKERHQFGRPVGSFQAIKHKLAETHLAVETALPAGWYAAYAIAHDLPDRSLAASVAKAYASDAAAKADRESLQCHGGIGFTWEHDLHLWLKRSNALQRTHGTAADHRRRIADELFAG